MYIFKKMFLKKCKISSSGKLWQADVLNESLNWSEYNFKQLYLKNIYIIELIQRQISGRPTTKQRAHEK